MTTDRQVLLVHGWFDRAGVMDPLREALEVDGHRVLSPSLTPSTGHARLEVLGAQLRAWLEEHTCLEERLDIVAFSMGGLIARHLLQTDGNWRARTDRLITLSTPHRGTFMGWFWPLPGTLQMRPGSRFLTELNAGLDILDEVALTCFWSCFDLTIVPPEHGSSLPGRPSRGFPVLIHAWMTRDKRVLAAVRDTLRLPVGSI